MIKSMEEDDQHHHHNNNKIATHTQLQDHHDDDDDDDDGPPPGFQCILNRPPPPQAAADDEEDDGPPPGFDSFAPRSSPLGTPVNESNGFHHGNGPYMEKGSKQDEINDVNDDDEGPPPGWEFSALESALPVPISITTDRKRESNEELDEGPPPGWETPLPHQTPLPCTPPLQSSSSVSSSIEIEGKVKITSNDDEVPPSAPDGRPVPEHSLPVSPPSNVPSNTIGNKGKDKKVRIKRPTFGNQPSSSKPPAQPSSCEKAQLICGQCRKLCWYPRGAKWVQCPGCLETNFVLEAQEVGQVKCGRCEVLLMYPHWAPAVQCTSCQFVTEIGEHNRRPPLSVQQEAKRRVSRSNRAR